MKNISLILIINILFITLLSITPVSATSEFLTFNQEIIINNDLTTNQIIDLTISEAENFNFNLASGNKINQILIDGIDQTSNCQIESKLSATNINCNLDLNPHHVLITASNPNLIISNNNKYLFSLVQEINTNDYSIKITLPKTSSIDQSRKIAPSPSYQYQIEDKTVMIWEFTDNNQANISFMANKPKPSYLNFIIYIVTIPVIIIIFLMFKKIYQKNKSTKSGNNKKQETNKSIEKIQSKFDYLLENEKKVISAITESSKGFLWQKELQIKTGLSKVQLSRTLRRMQERNLVIKEPHGASNQIFLKDKNKD